jgi:hypothetical protein
MSLGGRVDGIPIDDLLGGGAGMTIKRTAHVIFAEPGLSLMRGARVPLALGATLSCSMSSIILRT